MLGGGGGAAGSMKALKSLKLLRFLKLGRLLKIDKILSNLDRDTLDKLEDFLQAGGTRSAIVMTKLLIGLAYSCHIMACCFVLVGRAGALGGDPSWLQYDYGVGPDDDGWKGYTAQQTRGSTYDKEKYASFQEAEDNQDMIPDSGPATSIYIAAFYFCLTTMTSVGYGDIITRNDGERIFAIILELIGAIIFAMVIAQITAVVSTMDTNARAISEQLDAVTSFVIVRNFPEALGRRIRRHFRNFYSRKSAIDEVKIFSEMSTGLRREVSAFLVTELMGQDSFFSTMPPLLWPKLLPILKPVRMEKGESICMQGEECVEMYVVLEGSMLGSMVVAGEEEPRTRHITMGNSVNVLCAMGVWNKCVETVDAEVSVDAYAVVAEQFKGLFTADHDVAHFAKMQYRESSNFKMDTSDLNAPTPFGKPL